MIRFDIVVAADEEMGIGKDRGLPWDLPADMARFQSLTKGDADAPTNTVIMGRTTWESVPCRFQPLPGRRNVVLTRQPEYKLPEEVWKASSLEAALDRLDGLPDPGQVFVIGGAQVYREALGLLNCRAIHLTRIHARFDCDAFISEPGLEYDLSSKSDEHEENGVRYHFEEYERRA